MKIKSLLAVTISPFIAACVTIPFFSKEDLKKNAEITESATLRGNYQKLARCWDERANRITIDFANAKQMQIYTELKVAELVASWGYRKPAYGILIELKAIDENSTSASAFGTGYIGEQNLSNWMETLKKCQES